MNFYVNAVYLPTPVHSDILELYANNTQKVLDKGNNILLVDDFHMNGINWIHKTKGQS